MRHQSLHVVAPLLAVALLAASCGNSGADAADDDAIVVVATTTILGDIAHAVAGDIVRVETLIGQGKDPHSFQASAAQAAMLLFAPVVVANGLGLEEGLGDVLESAVSDGGVLVEIGPAVDPLLLRGGAPDPHVWLDPVRMADAVNIIGDALIAAIPESTDRIRSNADEYRARLLATHDRIQAKLASIAPADRILVTNHDSLRYFAARYGFQVVGTVVPAGGALSAPSASDLADLVESIDDLGVAAIFAEASRPTRLAEVIAAELGRDVAVVELFTGSLGEPGSGAETYLGLLTTNAALVAEALAP